MNFGTMTTALERYGFDTTDPLAVWLNAGKNDFASEINWPFNETGPVIVAMAANSNSLTLPSDFYKPVSLKDNTNFRMIKYMEEHEFIEGIQDETQTGNPEVFTVQSGGIQVWPVPLVAINYRLVYQGSSPDMVNVGDVPQTAGGRAWPVDTHYPIVLNSAFLALMAENEEERATTALNQYTNMKMRLIGKYNVLQNTEMDATQDTQGYGDSMSTRGRSW